MTVFSTTNKSPLYTTPGTGPYSFNFKVFSPADIIVIRRLEDGSEQVLPNNQYTVSLNSDQNSSPGGSITLQPSAALVAGQKLLIIRSLEATQGVDIQNAGGFYPEVIESALDKLTMLIQNAQEELSRALKVEPTSTINVNDLLNHLASGGDGFIWKGNWAPATTYSKNNLVHANGSTYIAVNDHTSGSSFGADLALGLWQLLAAQGSPGTGTGDMLKSENLSGLTDIAMARFNIQAAKSGVNSDITELTGLTTPLSISLGGTGATTAAAAKQALGVVFSSYIEKTADFTVASGDNGKVFGCVGSITITLPTASSAGPAFAIIIRNVGTGTVTMQRSGSDTIDGASSIAMSAGHSCVVYSTGGTAWLTIGRQAGGIVNVQTFSSSGTWYKPAVGTMAMIECWGGGGGGCRYAGGAGGNCSLRFIPLADLPSTVNVTIGQGGAGTYTFTGNPGGHTTFGSFLIAHGGGNPVTTSGGAGGFGDNYSNTYGGGRGGSVSVSAGSAGPEYYGLSGGTSFYGGGGGGGGGNYGQGLGGVSIYGGNGGNGNGSAGLSPGGGGGGSHSGTGGSGANGYCRVTVF